MSGFHEFVWETEQRGGDRLLLGAQQIIDAIESHAEGTASWEFVVDTIRYAVGKQVHADRMVREALTWRDSCGRLEE